MRPLRKTRQTFALFLYIIRSGAFFVLAIQRFAASYTSVGFLCAVAATIAVLSIKPFVFKTVNTLASSTMDIYILHPLVSEIITIFGYKNWVIATFLNGSETTMQFLKFTAIYCISVFIVCGVISVILKKLSSVFKLIVK